MRTADGVLLLDIGTLIMNNKRMRDVLGIKLSSDREELENAKSNENSCKGNNDILAGRREYGFDSNGVESDGKSQEV